MHIVMFLDQHPDTLGGAQLSVLLQVKYIQKLGHVVTICSPKTPAITDREGDVTFPSWPISFDGAYRLTRPTKKIDTYIDRAFLQLPPVDVVHIQGDYWGAALGFSFAKRHHLPTVITFHNNLVAGTQHVLGKPLSKMFVKKMSGWFIKHVGASFAGNTANGWDYLSHLGSLADVRLSPTQHFSKTLMKYGMPGEVGVLSNGIDDEQLKNIKTDKQTNGRLRFVWTGRLSHEKRLMEFLEAVRLTDFAAEFVIYGSGALGSAARRYIQKYHLSEKVSLMGAVSSTEMLQVLAESDALVQTSIGFETQGRTVFEAISVGTPVILSDPSIAEDFSSDEYWLVDDDSLQSLANTITKAANEISSGVGKKPNLQKTRGFLQSYLSKEVVEIYTHLKSNRK